MAKKLRLAGRGRSPANGIVAKAILITLSPREQEIVTRLSMVEGPLGPYRLGGVQVLRALIEAAGNIENKEE